MKKYKIADYVLMWDFDFNETDVSKQPCNNLYIEKIWNMKDAVGKDELCTGVTIIDENTFIFSTFMCINYKMKVVGDKVECIGTTLTR